MNSHPFRPGKNARRFARDLDAGSFAETEIVAGLIDRLDPSRVSKLVEERVTRNLDRVRKPECTVAPAFFADPTMEKVVAVAYSAATVERLVREPFSKACQGRDQFESRSRRERAHPAIHHRPRFIFSQRLPIPRLDARNKRLPIERPHPRHREDASVARV